MAEAEDVLTDAARHATIWIQQMWRRRRLAAGEPAQTALVDVAPRLELMLEAVFGRHLPLRVAQPPARRPFLRRLFRRHDLPPATGPVPATNDQAIWLPPALMLDDPSAGFERYRLLALRLAIRAQRRAAAANFQARNVAERDLHLVLEACASDAALAHRMPVLQPALHALREQCLAARPDPQQLPARHQALERLARGFMGCARHPIAAAHYQDALSCDTALDTLALASRLLRQAASETDRHDPGPLAILLDDWTGVCLPPMDDASPDLRRSLDADDANDNDQTARSARLTRQPDIRKPVEDEDDKEQGALMIQSGAPTEHAEDPMGMQRPTDRDDETPADEFADSVSELAEARLVSTPEKARDVLLSDNPPQARAHQDAAPAPDGPQRITYPEWDYRSGAYIDPGATVHLLDALPGSIEWVHDTLDRHKALQRVIRQQFELLRPQNALRRRQLDGHDIDLAAYIDAFCDRRAGFTMPQGLYQHSHHDRRDTALMLLVDISGSTDSWLSGHQRIIDVEREALLLVCMALEHAGDPYSVLAFSGEGRHHVSLRELKGYDETWGEPVAHRIAGLEPENYTRAGAALRHATAELMRQPAQHRLLLLLTDGKPNDADHYEGRYGVEDMRQAVSEARLQGIFPFCLTIDWQAADYLPAIFGAHHYALLPKSGMLPTILLQWIRLLLSR